VDATTDDLNGLEISFWHPWEGELATRMKTLADEFNRSNEWGLKVKVTPHYNTDALTDAIDAGVREGVDISTPSPAVMVTPVGSRPDVVAASTGQLAVWAAAENPLLADLQPYIADSRHGLTEDEVSAYLPVFWEQDVRGDTRFGLPALRGARVLIYNRTWAEDLGFSQPPMNPEEFKKQVCAAAVANNAARVADLYNTGGLRVDSDPLTMLSWMAAFGADPLPPADDQSYQFDSKEAESSLTFLRGLMENGCAWIGSDPEPYDAFSKRKALFYTGSLEDLAIQQRWQNQAGSKDQWIALPFRDQDGKPIVYSGGFSYGILRSTPEKQLGAWLFIRWLSQPEQAFQLEEAQPSLPVTSETVRLAEAAGEKTPWNLALPLMEGLRPEPGLASWHLARRPLADAAWQVYHLPSDGLPKVLPQLDAMVEEMIED
jgi:ABC-type glycerol-3-phosphate transport system substrate-binding protein